jgi:hypothetical protein
VSVEDQANKLANTADRNARPRQTCSPANVASVRRFDQARAIGAKLLEQKESESISVNRNGNTSAGPETC